MREMVFEIVDGYPMPRSPREPTDRFITLDDAAARTGYSRETLRGHYLSTYEEILDVLLPSATADGGGQGASAKADDVVSPASGKSASPMASTLQADRVVNSAADLPPATPTPNDDTLHDGDLPGTDQPTRDRLVSHQMTLAHALHFPSLTESQFEQVREYAKTWELSLLARHVWAEARWDERVKGERLFIGPSIEGLRAIAHRTGQYAGNDYTEFEFDDDGLPLVARVTIYRKVDGEREAFRGEAVAAELLSAPGEGDVLSFRRQAPRTWLSKCALAAALRDAFELGGMYIPEEMYRTLRQLSAPKRPKRKAKSPEELEGAKLVTAESIRAGALKEHQDEEPEREVNSPQSFDLALVDFGAKDAALRKRVVQLARQTFPDLAKLEDSSRFYARAWEDVRRNPKAYGLPFMRVAG